MARPVSVLRPVDPTLVPVPVNPRRKLPTLARVADLDAANLQALMEDMGRGPGWYPTTDLYDWFSRMARAQGAEPVSKKAFGMALRGLGYVPSSQRDHSREGKLARGWFITRRALRGDLPRGSTD